MNSRYNFWSKQWTFCAKAESNWCSPTFLHTTLRITIRKSYSKPIKMTWKQPPKLFRNIWNKTPPKITYKKLPIMLWTNQGGIHFFKNISESIRFISIFFSLILFTSYFAFCHDFEINFHIFFSIHLATVNVDKRPCRSISSKDSRMTGGILRQIFGHGWSKWCKHTRQQSSYKISLFYVNPKWLVLPFPCIKTLKYS